MSITHCWCGHWRSLPVDFFILWLVLQPVILLFIHIPFILIPNILRADQPDVLYLSIDFSIRYNVLAYPVIDVVKDQVFAF